MMSRYVGQLYHPINHRAENVYEGFSWPCLFAGFFWYVAKGMLLWAIGAVALALVTFGISWFALPFFANKQYMQYLLQQGYLTREQLEERKQPA
jgi:hypothetical protein